MFLWYESVRSNKNGQSDIWSECPEHRVMSRHEGIPTQAKGYGVATMTVPSRAREFGFDFEILGEKKAPPIARQGLVILENGLDLGIFARQLWQHIQDSTEQASIRDQLNTLDNIRTHFFGGFNHVFVGFIGTTL